MRCYFMRKGHIEAVEVLPDNLSDEAAINMAREFFELYKDQGRLFDGFEVWFEARFICRWPPDSPNASPVRASSSDRSS